MTHYTGACHVWWRAIPSKGNALSTTGGKALVAGQPRQNPRTFVTLSLFDHLLGFLVVTKTNERGVPQTIPRSPSQELDSGDNFGFQPSALLHLRGSESLTPDACLLVREIRKGALRDLVLFDPVEHQTARSRSETRADPACIPKLDAVVEAHDQRVHPQMAERISTDYQFLSHQDARLRPCVGTSSSLVQEALQRSRSRLERIGDLGLNFSRDIPKREWSVNPLVHCVGDHSLIHA